MWQGTYGKEPFDLRLTVLRFIRCLDKMIIFTLAGTLLFGGGYFVKNVIFRPAREYAVTSTYMVEYKQPPVQSGDYYINDMTWNTLVTSGEFLDAVDKHLGKNATSGEISGTISAKLPSDWNIPTTTVVTEDPETAVLLAQAVEKAMAEDLPALHEGIKEVHVLDPAVESKEVALDARPGRAFVLSGILSLFFVTMVFIIREIGDDSIWLPATLRARYGLKVLGTINSPQLPENAAYLFEGKKKIAVCPVSTEVDVKEAAEALTVIWRRGGKTGAEKSRDMVRDTMPEWIASPSPLLCPESADILRGMDGILLVVPSGAHAGKQLEYTLEYLHTQDCTVTAALLWDADERLIRNYYWL